MIFNDFAKYVLKNPEKDIMDAYNDFMLDKKECDQKFLASNCMLMLKIGKAARKTVPSVQKMLA